MTRSDDDDSPTATPESVREFERAVADAVERARRVVDAGPYEPSWDSLADHDEAPEWFRDAKFGLYCHWGVYSVPAYNSEWYPRWMYMTDPSQADPDWGNDVYPHHVETYGEPDEHPYQAFVPEFTAENFDPEAWAELFEAAGARFAGPAAEHHDGWSNWDSSINPWNASDRGPERDPVGELEAAVRDRDIRFLTSFHHARTKSHFEFAFENFPSVTEGYPDRVMYGNLADSLRFDLWLAKLVEVIDEYEPDLIWHDSSLPEISEDHHRRYLAYYFDVAAESDRDVVVAAKHRQFPPEVAVEDFERGRPAELRDRPWLTDTSIVTGGWSYTEGGGLESVRTVLHELIDVVSKNGCMLLNFAPRADGSIPEAQREHLLAIGEWLDVHGEAIYGTRPWTTFGEGPTRLEEGGHFLDDVEYTAEDVRYTRDGEGETLYAIVMGWPDGESITLESVDVGDAPDGRVELLGVDEPVAHEVTDDGHLAIAVPDLPPADRPSEDAVAFALSGFDLVD